MGRTDLAAAMLLDPTSRLARSGDPAGLDGDGPLNRKSLLSFTDDPVVRALLTLSDSAQIRFVEVQTHDVTAHHERMRSLWAVTYEKDGQPQTFLLRVILERDARRPRTVHAWELGRVPDLVTVPPQGWPRQADASG